MSATGMAAGAYLVLPGPLVDAVIPVFGLLCSAAVLVRAFRLRREPVWWLVGMALLLSAAGDAAWYALEHVARTQPFPSLADVFYLAAYPLLAAGFAVLVRREIRGIDRAGLIDSCIVVAGAAALALVVVVEPYVHGGRSSLEVVVGLAYPLGDLLVLGLLARLLLTPTNHPWPVRLLALGTLGMFASDVAFITLDLHGGFQTGTPVDLGWLLWFGLTATAAWLPQSIPGEGAMTRHVGIPPARLALLTVASLMAPGVLVVQGLRGKAVDGLGIGLVTAAAFLLVLTRMAGLVRDVQSNATSLTLLSELDPLTGLANRRVWDREVPRAVEVARRTDRLLTVAMIDLDLFKRLNDTRGHSAGDQVLISAGAEWSRQLRRGDLLSRVGGEEFGVLLPGADESTAMEIVERLRDSCPWPMTCSAGVAVLHPDESAADVLERADRALYEAKERGRDMTVLSLRPRSDLSLEDTSASPRFDEWPVFGDGSISGEGTGTAPAD